MFNNRLDTKIDLKKLETCSKEKRRENKYERGTNSREEVITFLRRPSCICLSCPRSASLLWKFLCSETSFQVSVSLRTSMVRTRLNLAASPPCDWPVTPISQGAWVGLALGEAVHGMQWLVHTRFCKNNGGFLLCTPPRPPVSGFCPRLNVYLGIAASSFHSFRSGYHYLETEYLMFMRHLSHPPKSIRSFHH